MKLSISLSHEDVAALDEYVRSAGIGSRSEGVRHAIRVLSRGDLEHDYAAAWAEWDEAGERAAWETTTADGLDAPG